jgi:osmotically-inducible protein OsmY
MHEKLFGSGTGQMHGWALKYMAGIFFMTLLLMFSAYAHGAEEITDANITLAVDRQLAHDQNIPANLITTSTANGVVTLTGAVDNLLAKERSEKIAATVKGVRSVINLITVLPFPSRTDEEIKYDIIRKLLADPVTEADEIKVQVKDGVATLSGVVDSYQEGVLAGKVAEGVDGVVELQNDLTFIPKEDRSDTEIQTEIRDRFYWDVWVNDAAFRIEVHKGEVKISGTARSVEEMNRVEYLAWVAGVKSVDTSNVEVDWSKGKSMVRDREPEEPSDSDIRKAVTAAFTYDPRLSSSTFEVLVENGFVTLTGTAATILEKNAAGDDARDTEGVLRVKNMIKVQPPNRISDEDIRKSVEAAYKNSPYVTESQVDVSVVLGRVYLNGTVESFFEKDKAGELAAKQKGVVDVQNNLAVYKGKPGSEDWEILEDIRTELWWSPFVDAKKVKVSVKNGVAYLSGEVDTLNEKAAAEKNAYEGGAKAVINNLTVKDIPYYTTDD